MNLTGNSNQLESVSSMNRAPTRHGEGKMSEVVAAAALTLLFAPPPTQYPLFAAQPIVQKPKRLEIPQRYTKNGRKRAVPFPLKLMEVLSDEKYSHILSWMPGGRSFVIIRPKAFVSEILPKHFKSAQYASFTRKLHRWGFSRLEDGTGEFFHPSFRKGRVDLAERMACSGLEPLKSTEAKNKEASSDQDDDSEASSKCKESSPVKRATPPPCGAQPPTFDLDARRFEESMHAAAMTRRALAEQQYHQMMRSTAFPSASLTDIDRLLGYERLNAWRVGLALPAQADPNSPATTGQQAIIRGAKTA